jgi:hypothetical protein
MVSFQGAALRARDAAGERFRPRIAALSFALFALFPVALHGWRAWEVDRAVLRIEAEGSSAVESAARRFELLGPAFDRDRLARAWRRTESPDVRADLQRLYELVIGDHVRFNDYH